MNCRATHGLSVPIVVSLKTSNLKFFDSNVGNDLTKIMHYVFRLFKELKE